MSEYYDDLWDEHYDSIYGKINGVYECNVKFTTKDGKKHNMEITENGRNLNKAIKKIKKGIKKEYDVKGKILAKRTGDYWSNNDWQ